MSNSSRFCLRRRKAINSAKVRYLSAVFETPEAESAVRPEAIPNA